MTNWTDTSLTCKQHLMPSRKESRNFTNNNQSN